MSHAAVLDAPAEADAEQTVKDAEAEGLTELTTIDPDRVDGVATPANGFPTLMIKTLGSDGEDEDDEAAKAAPDEDEGDGDTDSEEGQDRGAEDASRAVKAADATAEQREAYTAAAAEWRAREPLWKGRGDGTEYLQMRSAWKLWQAEGAEAGLDGTEAGARAWLETEAVKAVAAAEDKAVGKDHREFSAGRRKNLASEGNALPDGSYPIPDADALRRAAVLARSGHGNAAGAKRLIARRARELGVANPLDSKDKAASKDGAKPPRCSTCKGTGKIRGGSMTCPDCKGKNAGNDDDAKAEKAGEALAEATATLAKMVAAGLITQAAAAALLAEAAEKAKRPLPADVKPAGPHREPDGTSTVEVLEPQAGLGTDPDKTKDKVPASVDQASKDIPYALQRMHDATCAAYDADDVLAEYPALKGVTDALDPAMLAAQAATDEANADRWNAMAKEAQALRSLDPAVIADGRALVHKAFTDMYPSTRLSPGSPPAPGSYHRPYLSAGHAAEHAGGGASVPPSSHVPDPGQFQRGYLSAGHAAPSPADSSASRPIVTGSSRANYAAAAKTYAAQSMKAMHDHLVASYASACPMAASPALLPPDMGARNVPAARAPLAPGGVDTVKSGETMTEYQTAAETVKELRKARKRDGQFAAEVARQAGETVKAMLDAQLAPLKEHYETRISDLAKQVEELGAQPDPALAPVRGQLARPAAGTAAPVEKRSLVDEARDREQRALAAQAAEHAAYIDYVRKAAQSTNPQVREPALAVLHRIGADAAKTAAA